MSLEPSGIRDYLQEELTYPIDEEEVTRKIGDVEIQAPDGEDSETIGELLEGLNTNEFGSADELNEAVQTMLPEDYIGRKYYDDRSDTTHDARTDQEEQSF